MPSTSAESSHAIYFRNFISHLCEMLRYSRAFEDDWDQCGSCLEWWHEDWFSWESGGSFLRGRCSNWRTAQSRTPFCALLSIHVSKSAYFENFLQSTTAKSTYVFCQFLCLSFAANTYIKFGMYFNFIYCQIFAEPSRKTVKCTILAPPFPLCNF
jgi:hypothetical protein